jgi:hypothetical protein
VRSWGFALVGCACGRIGFGLIAGSGNPGDGGPGHDSPGSVVIPTNANLAFVTSMRRPNLGAIGGIAAADQLCSTSAAAAGLAGTYVAWVSTSTVNAIDRLGSARGWVRPDGRLFADTAADIAASRVYYPLDVDESGSALDRIADGSVLTLTQADGTVAAGATCGDLTTTAGSGQTGFPLELGAAWTAFAQASCVGSYHLYCFGIDHITPLAAPAPPQRYAFVSTETFAIGGGVTAADAVCASEASNAGLPGTYLAVLATASASAGSRFHVGFPWAKPDGAVVTAALERPLTPIDETATGSVLSGVFVWTGAGDLVSTGAETCTDWTDVNAGYAGYVGSTTYAGLPAIEIGTQGCTGAYHLYCFEE